MKSPVASMYPEMLLWRFKDDQRYVSRFHAAGFRHGATLSNVYARPSQLQKEPALQEGIDRTVAGEIFESDGGWYLGKQPFMCQNSPQWQDSLLERSKTMIDAGSDVIVFDEPFGDTIFASLPIPQFPGFSNGDLQLLADALAQNFAPDAIFTNQRVGIAYHASGDMSQALEHFRTAETLAKKIGSKYFLAEALYEIGMVSQAHNVILRRSSD